MFQSIIDFHCLQISWEDFMMLRDFHKGGLQFPYIAVSDPAVCAHLNVELAC
jgi:hypothetical protein